jgi:hypothetical protein
MRLALLVVARDDAADRFESLSHDVPFVSQTAAGAGRLR